MVERSRLGSTMSNRAKTRLQWGGNPGDDSHSLDYSLLSGGGGGYAAKISGKPRGKFLNEVTPGPGKYRNEGLPSKVPAVIFGTERRPLLNPIEKTDSRTAHSYYCNFSHLTYEEAAAHSFGRVKRSVDNTQNNPENFTPGPGHYNYHLYAITPKSVSYSISRAQEKKRQSLSNADFIDQQSSLHNKGYQKFSESFRFPLNGNRRYHYRRIIRHERPSSLEFLNKTIQQIHEESPKYRREKISLMAERLKNKIHITRLAKLKITEDWVGSILQKRQEIDRRKLIRKEKTWKVAHGWIELLSTEGWLRMLSAKFNVRKMVRHRTNKLMRILFVCFLAVGKIMRKLRVIRMKRGIKLLNSVAKVKAGLWRLRRRIKHKKNISKFLLSQERSSSVILFLKFLICKVIRIQRWWRKVGSFSSQ